MWRQVYAVHMDSSNVQNSNQKLNNKDRRASSATKDRLLRAAADLVVELGWGRVTTRAIAERADLPHGTVSYHFNSKQELLIDAVLRAVEDVFPIAMIRELNSVTELVALIAATLTSCNALDSVETRVLMESMREAGREPLLRKRLADLLSDYRQALEELIRNDQGHSNLKPGLTPSALAMLLSALGDGLLLHLIVDPELDVGEAVKALGSLLGVNLREAPNEPDYPEKG